MSDQEPKPGTDEVPAREDTESDPALDGGESTDWSGEGGATDEGPATEVDDA